MRIVICLIPLLCGCSTHVVRCDAHLRPINPPAQARAGTAAIATPSATPSATAKPLASRRTP
jgi:hypothetical protein